MIHERAGMTRGRGMDFLFPYPFPFPYPSPFSVETNFRERQNSIHSAALHGRFLVSGYSLFALTDVPMQYARPP